LLPPIWSRRKRQAQATGQDVYQYDTIPTRVRVQVIQLLEAGLGAGDAASSIRLIPNPCYEHIVKVMRRNVGVYQLAVTIPSQFKAELFSWLHSESDINYWLDGVEVSLQTIETWMQNPELRGTYHPSAEPGDIIVEFNDRLMEAAIGYQYVSGQINRIESQHMHIDVVVPTLQLLNHPRFESANSEYRSAHEAFRHGRLEDSIVDCGKALESVLKIIGRKRKWKFNDNDTASKLVKAAVDAGFLAAYLDPSLNHLKGLIETSTPVLRNKTGAHGAGVNPRVVPPHLAAFQLHQTAAVILYLMKQDSALG
jgi:hypothetical protein